MVTQPAGALRRAPSQSGQSYSTITFFEPLVHAGVRLALLAVLAVVMLQLIDDAVELDLLAGVLLPELRLRRQQDLELLPLGAVEEHLHVLLGQILEGRIEAEP